jgi:hypothetical protein
MNTQRTYLSRQGFSDYKLTAGAKMFLYLRLQQATIYAKHKVHIVGIFYNI